MGFLSGIGAGLAGGLFGGGGGGGGGGGSSTVTSVPWDAQQPYLTDIYGRGQDLSNTPMPFYPGNITAPTHPLSQGSQQAQMNAANWYGADILPNATMGMSNLANQMAGGPQGQQMNVNPYMYQQMSGQVNYAPYTGALGALANQQRRQAGVNSDIFNSQYNRAYGQMGNEFARQAATSADTYNQQQAALRNQYGRQRNQLNTNLNENLVPMNNTEAAMMGQSGSSRHGVAEGILRKGVTQQLSDLAGQQSDQLSMMKSSQQNALRNMLGQQQDQLGNMRGDYMDRTYANRYGDAERLSDASSRMYADAYSNAQNNAVTATGNAANYNRGIWGDQALRGQTAAQMYQALPGMASSNINIIGTGGQIGAQRQQQLQRQLGEAQGRWDYGNQEPWNRLNMYSNLVQNPGMGGYGTQSTQGGSNTFGNILGLGLTGLGLYNQGAFSGLGGMFGGGAAAAAPAAAGSFWNYTPGTGGVGGLGPIR